MHSCSLGRTTACWSSTGNMGEGHPLPTTSPHDARVHPSIFTSPITSRPWSFWHTLTQTSGLHFRSVPPTPVISSSACCHTSDAFSLPTSQASVAFQIQIQLFFIEPPLPGCLLYPNMPQSQPKGFTSSWDFLQR